MGLVEHKGLLMEEEVVEQLKLRHEQDDSCRWDNEAAERKQDTEINQTVERKQTYEFMQNDVNKDNDVSGVWDNRVEAANKEETDIVSKHNKDTVCDRDKEDDCMREYKVNGVLILACDNGYGNTKGAHVVFRTSVDVSDTPPAFSKDYLEHKGKYYILSEGHKNFVADKVMDDDTYILTLATIAKELKMRGLHEAKIHLTVGLPLKWVKAQSEAFRQYMLRDRFVDFKYKDERYKVEIVDCTVMPQCYAAVAEKLKEFKGMNLLVDIGNGTMNLMYLNNGRAAENKSWTEKFGINQCAIRIKNAVRDKTGTEMPEDVVENFLRSGKLDIEEPYVSIMVGEAEAAAEAVWRAAEQARRKAEKEAEARRRAIEEEKRRQKVRRKEEQKKKERIRGLYDKIVSEADRLADTVFGLRFDQPYKWEYINYIDERRFTPMAELTEEDMHKPFLTYEQFVAEKERLRESAIVDMPQREVIPEISKSVLEDDG